MCHRSLTSAGFEQNTTLTLAAVRAEGKAHFKIPLTMPLLVKKEKQRAYRAIKAETFRLC